VLIVIDSASFSGGFISFVSAIVKWRLGWRFDEETEVRMKSNLMRPYLRLRES